MTIAPDVKALWRAPFRADGTDVVDADERLVCYAFGPVRQVAPVYLRHDEALCRSWRDTFRAIVGTETDPDAVARLLTEAWEATS